jgi:hypothetical protein
MRFILELVQRYKFEEIRAASYHIGDNSVAWQDLEKLLNLVPGANLLVGVPTRISEIGRNRVFDRYVEMRSRFPRIKWKFHTASHIKLFAARRKGHCVIITGGHNLTSSPHADMSIAIENNSRLYDQATGFFDHVCTTATDDPPEGNITERQMPSRDRLLKYLYALAKRQMLERYEFIDLLNTVGWCVSQDGVVQKFARKHYGMENDEELKHAESLAIEYLHRRDNSIRQPWHS